MTDSRSDPTIVQRLMQALEADTAVELARALGLPVTDVEQALAKGQVPDEWVRICAAETGCNADWLFFGRGPMRLPLVESGAMPACLMLEDVDDDVDMITVPLVVARLSAGSGSLEVSSEQEGGYAFRSDFFHRKGNPRRMVLMRVSGDSMVPEIQDNDLVLLDQGQTEIVSGRLYAIGFEDAIYIKRSQTILPPSPQRGRFVISCSTARRQADCMKNMSICRRFRTGFCPPPARPTRPGRWKN